MKSNETLTLAECLKLPKIELHDHLDGGLRPDTLLELLRKEETDHPFTDKYSIASYLAEARQGSLERYLSLFSFTVAAMASPDAIVRVAREAVEDWAKDGVRYGEIRMAPELLVKSGFTLEDAIESMLKGLAEGEQSTGVKARLIVCAMRHQDNGEAVARAASRFAGKGVVAFDIAGPERGWGARRFEKAFGIARAAGLGLTAHAGEAAGPESIDEAVKYGQVSRIGHGVHLVDNWVRSAEGLWQIDELSRFVYEQRIGLEVCVSSNLQTGSIADLKSHPLGDFLAQGFTVTINTDNRLISACTLSEECALAVQSFGLSKADLLTLQKNARGAAFDQGAFKDGLGTELDIAWDTWLRA